MKRRFIRFALLALTLALTAGSCLASEGYAFAAGDFPGLSGAVITQVPDEAQGTLRCGSRTIRAGDVLSAASLNTLCFVPASDCGSVCTLRYLPISGNRAGAAATLSLQIFGKKANQPPAAREQELETYRNIPLSGMLQATDPEGDALRFSLAEEPRRGSVLLAADGSFTYTPDRNKVGADSFTFTVSDDRGGVSEETTVRIRIRKPDDKTVFADLAGNGDAYYAMWLRDQGLLSGETVAGQLCFEPDKPVSRGEFVVLVMQLFELEPAEETLHSGFADEAQTSAWMQPYLSSAVSAGLISGSRSESGLVFRPDEAVTEAEAAVILQNLLRFPSAEAVSSEDAVETWAADAVGALSGAGTDPLSVSAAPLTRLRCAKLLWQCWKAAEGGRYGLLAWAAEK